MNGSFLEEPSVSPQVRALYDEDLADTGYVWNVSRLWAHQPDTLEQLFGLMSEAFTPSGLNLRQRGILAWRTKPSWSIVANQDQTVNPELERFAAKRMGAMTYEIDSSHVPMLSYPNEVLDVIRTAATSI
jgi:pimeloyl-ACP methyl ester carboxylesterase